MSLRTLIFFTGLLLPFIIVFTIKLNYYFNGEITDGIVIKENEILTESGNVIMKKDIPVILYQVQDVKYFYPYQDKVLFKRLRNGEKVKIIYDPDYPSESYIYSYFTFWWQFPTLIIIIFVLGIWIGFFTIIPQKSDLTVRQFFRKLIS